MRKTLTSLSAASALVLALLIAGGTPGNAAAPQRAADDPGALPTGQCPRLVAHRGGFETPPDTNENSMAAFRRAADIGVWALETDVWFSKDKVPVLMHDATLDRTTDGTGKISDYTYAQLQAVRLNNGERIPTLKQILTLLKQRDIWGFIEYKDADDPDLYRRYLAELKKSGAKVFGAGFSVPLMEWLHQEDPDLPLMWFGKRIQNVVPTDTPPADVPKGADPGLINIRIAGPPASVFGIGDYTAMGQQVNVWFNRTWGGDNASGDTTGAPASVPGPNPAAGLGWDSMAGKGVTWITTDFPDQYVAWTKTTSGCSAPAPKKSTAECVTMPKPKKVRAGRTYTILDKRCATTGGRVVNFKVHGPKKVVKKVGLRKVTVKREGRFTLKATAPAVRWSQGGQSWQSYMKYFTKKTYRVSR